MHLATYLEESARRHPDSLAVVEPSGRAISYRELDRDADALAAFLAANGIGGGARVGVVAPKSVDAVIALFGIMKAGAAYVPVDYTAPSDRGKGILTDCDVRAVIVDPRCLAMVPETSGQQPPLVVTLGKTTHPGSTTLAEAISGGGPRPSVTRSASDLAYLLYTSGSTGVPKGVMLTHANAVSFVEWCTTVFRPTADDRFSSHAPFHFDLSVLDLYLSVKHGATVYLIPDDLGKNPKSLAQFIAQHRLTIWYSTPSILMLLLQFGDLSAVHGASLRLVLFAGEVFPVKHLREVQRRWPQAEYYNLYGPTETNVCTFAKIPDEIPDDRDTPYPIGFTCSHCASTVLDEDGVEISGGDEGLLHIAGPSLFQGYWHRPLENAKAFIERAGVRWYNTGDVVRWVDGEGFRYVGRKDRMVKRRGYRIELGEIERALYAHSAVREAAVVSVPDQDGGVRIVAFVACRGDVTPSIVEMKTHCGGKLPAYMNPDRFLFRPTLPKTSTDKIDYQLLSAQV